MAKKKQKKQKQPSTQQFLSPEQFMRQRARSLEIDRCYVSEDLTGCGEGFVIVSRKHTGGRISYAMYMIDTYCLGVKDSLYQLRLEDQKFEELLELVPDLRKCSYEEAHNWVYGAISWAAEAGIEPDASFDVTQYMLEEDTDEVPLIEYEFGRNGKHCLMANDHLEASRYLPLLETNLGHNNFVYFVKNNSESPAPDAEKILECLQSPMFKSVGPSTEHTYQHPEYPASLQLEGPEWLYDELNSPAYPIYLPDELTDRILALPHETVRHDLEQMVLYHLGLTCESIPEDYNPHGYAGLISHCIFLLGEVGNEDSSLEVVLEVLRQSDACFHYHFGDSSHEVFVPTLYLLGQNRLDRLMDFAKEEGLDTFCKCLVFPAVAHIALVQPERRTEVVEWFREIVRFATKMLPQTQWFDSNLAGLMLYDLIDIQAVELLPEIREMFDTNLVDLGSCGDYSEVSRLINDPSEAGDPDDTLTEIHKRFADMKRRWEH